MIEERIGCGPQIGRQIVSGEHALANWVDGKPSSFCICLECPRDMVVHERWVIFGPKP